MKTRAVPVLVGILLLLIAADAMDAAFARGGRGGGGGRGRGGGGVSRPTAGFSGSGAARSTGGFSGATRASIGSSPSLNRAGGTATRATSRSSRPQLAGGSTLPPSLQPGTRPNLGKGPGSASRPFTSPSTRPGTAGIGARAEIAERPGSRLSGQGIADVGSRLPNQGVGLTDRAANRPQTMEDRRTSLNNRITSRNEQRQTHRGDQQDDRQDWRDSNREDWQNYGSEHHGDWYNGSWDPGEGWDYMWDNYPGAAALGVTRWGVNRVAYGFGYWGYSNPYVTDSSSSGSSYSYSEPLVNYSESTSESTSENIVTEPNLAEPGAAEPGAAERGDSPTGPPTPTEAGMSSFEQARTSFYSGEYETALSQLDITLQTMPQDTVVHEFRGLVLFALKKYPDAAATIYAVLSAGPGWDWTTMSGLYPNVDVYTRHLRELETFMQSNPMSADASFLLGYHYLTMGHQETAAGYFSRALQQLPGDKLLTQLVQMNPVKGGAAKTQPSPLPNPTALTPDQILSMEKLVGAWKASGSDAPFELTLTADGTFTWNYTRGKALQSIKGVFAVDQNNLVMEPDSGGTMIATIVFSDDTQFQFKMVGGEPNDPGLMFLRN